MTTVYQNQLIKWTITGFLVWIGNYFFWALVLGGGALFNLIFLISPIVILIIFFVKRPRKNSQGYDSFDYTAKHSTKKEIDTSRPLKIVKERLAKGEITTDEFNELKKEFE